MSKNPELFVVGLGASAGGLKALELFFRSAPIDTGMSFVVVQHLSPDFKSLMDDLLARHTTMKIHRVENDMELAPNEVYLIPPKSLMTIREGRLWLQERDAGKGHELPINIFFHSMAEDCGARCAAVILSGTGTDGTEGVHSVHRAGGLIVAQTPSTAEFDGMPRSVVASGLADYILPPERMTESILAFLKNPALRFSAGQPGNAALDVEGGEYAAVFHILRHFYALDFSNYKLATIERRVQRRMSFQNLTELTAYTKLLEENAAERDALYHDLLIGVTEFFRDPQAFAYLHDVVFPELLTRRRQEEIRVWTVGCATGEEAYSIAIMLDEVARKTGFMGKFSIFATDVHRTSLEVAAAGLYDQSKLKNIGAERQATYFREEKAGMFRIVPEIRHRIVFAPHNIISDPPFTKLDLISCRNMLIYFASNVQERILALFHYALRQNSYMFLGSSEGLGRLENDFEVNEAKYKIFRKVKEVPLHIDIRQTPSAVHVTPVRQPIVASGGHSISINRSLLRAYDHLLSKHISAGLLITESWDVLHFFGEIGRYLKPQEGRADSNFLERVEGDLRLAVSTLVPRVLKTGVSSVSRGVRISLPSGLEHVDVHVEPIFDEKTGTTLVHISLQDPRSVNTTVLTQTSPDAESFHVSEAVRKRIQDLELELQSTKENLQALVEELQTSNEELQATNEEMLASNEELQSTNEELHSVNEELYTVNAEFERKNTELKQVNEDMDNLLTSMDVGIVFLDRQQRIRKFNPAIERIFNLLPQDVGRPIDHIAYHLDDQQRLLDDVRIVLNTGRPVQREVRTREGGWLLKRVLPFLAAHRAIEGVVLSFTEISAVKAIEDRLKMAMESARLVWWEWDVTLNVLTTHAVGWCILGYSLESLQPTSETWYNLIHPEDRQRVRDSVDSCLQGRVNEWESEHRFKARDGSWLWVINKGRVVERDTDGRAVRMLGTTQEINQRKIAEETLARDSHLLAKVRDGIICTEPGGTITYANEAAAAYLSTTPGHARGKLLSHFLPESLLERIFEGLAEAREGKEFCEEWLVPRKTGESLWLEIRLWATVGPQNQANTILGIIKDVTERRRAEETIRRLSRAIEQSPVSVVITDLYARIEYVNATFCSVSGFAEHELIGENPRLLKSTRTPPSVYRELWDQITSGRTWSGELLNKRKNGELFWERVVISPIKNATGQTTHYLGIKEDITQLKDEEEKRRQLEIQLYQAQKMETMGTLAGGIAHDFNNILTGLLGHVDLVLLDLPEEDTSRPNIQEIRKAGVRARELVQQILAFSRAKQPSKAPVAIDMVINEALSLMRASIPTNIEISVQIERGRFFTLGDSSQIHQVIMNLCSNALDALETSGGKLIVSLVSVKADEVMIEAVPGLRRGMYHKLGFSDTGPGIPPEILKRIFEPFFTTKQVGKGTGLGLSVVHGIITNHGGAIEVRSAVGKGTTFNLYLPAISATAEAVVPQQAFQIPRGKGERIVLVDDEATVLSVAQRHLQRLGYETIVFNDPEDARKLLENPDEKISLLITDQTMPHLSGIELVRLVRRVGHKFPVIIMSGFNKQLSEERFSPSDAVLLLGKPFSADELARITWSALNPKEQTSAPPMNAASPKNVTPQEPQKK